MSSEPHTLIKVSFLPRVDCAGLSTIILSPGDANAIAYAAPREEAGNIDTYYCSQVAGQGQRLAEKKGSEKCQAIEEQNLPEREPGMPLLVFLALVQSSPETTGRIDQAMLRS